ncbi:MAG: IS110 family transposase [Proteobacteria bacterium]|nr:IS110 family transposase [Pseudomonadota bacterium]
MGGEAMSGLKGSFDNFVGIDVSKDKFDACGITGDERKLFQFSAAMDRKGFEKLKDHLAVVSVSSVLIGMESTASYHVNLFSYLVSEGYNVLIVNPLLISNYVKMQLRKTKTDKKDAVVIALFLLANGSTLIQRVTPSLISDLRDLSRQRESLVDEMTALKINIKRLLNITFPELEHMTLVFTKSMLKVLKQYPSAFALRSADLVQLSQMLITDSYGRKREAFATELIKAARSSIGINSPAKEIILKQQVTLLLHLEDALREITGVLIEMSRKLMEEDINILTSIKGIGDKSAVNFLVEMGGDITQYDDSGKIIAMAGLDPAVYQSGQHEGKGRITKRGNRHLRRIIWMMTTRVIHYSDMFKVYYLKRRKEGLPYKMAVLATAHKLIRVIYAMLKQRTTFCPQANS